MNINYIALLALCALLNKSTKETELYQTAPELTDEVTIIIKMEKGINPKSTDLAEKKGISIEGIIHSIIKAELEKEEGK